MARFLASPFAVISLALAFLLNALALAEKAVPQKNHGQHETVPIKADFTITPQAGGKELSAGQPATLEFRLSDTEKPLTGQTPLAWLVRDELGKPMNEQQCAALVHSLLHGSLNQQAEVNLSSFLVLTLNQDHSISVVDPQLAWAKTKLLALVELPGRGDDWFLDPSRARLYVAMPEIATLAVINTETWRIAGTVDLRAKGQTAQMALSPGGKHLWLVLDDQPEVLAIGLAKLQVTARLPIKKGQHGIAVAKAHHLLFISSSEADAVSVIDTQALKSVAEIPVAGQPLAMAANPMNGLIYVSAPKSNALAVIDPQKQAVVASPPIEKGNTQIRFDPEGRYGLALNRAEATVSLIDASQQKVLVTTKVAEQPDQALFSTHYAYVRSLGSAQFAVFDRSQIAKGVLAPASVAAGQQPALANPSSIGHLDMVAPTPDGHGALIANGPDRKLYYYMEGMMAASGTVDNGGRVSTGILMLDRSLKETQAGQYRVNLKLPAAGDYTVPLSVSGSHFIQCFNLKVTANAQDQRHSANARPVAPDLKAVAGEAVELVFLIEDSISGQPIDTLSDVQILITEVHGQRQSKRRASFDKSGTYKIRQRFQYPGIYGALVRVPSLGIDFKRTSQIQINVLPKNAR